MANPEHLEMLKRGIEDWNRWRTENPSIQPDLREADLSGAVLDQGDFMRARLSNATLEGALLRGANLKFCKLSNSKLNRADLSKADLTAVSLARAELREADLHGANLSWSMMLGATLRRATLEGADLRGVRFSGANLTEANLAGADLSGADLTGTNLTNTDLHSAIVSSTRFTAVNLSVAKGLEGLRHMGPSSVGIDTLFKSRGKIPEVFLRGCGVPQEFIDFARRIGTRIIEFYSCFISYSTHDQEFADRLYADLQNKGVRCWFAPHNIKGGRKIHEQLDEAIRLHDKLLLILSDASMNSDWVGTEVANARERESREGKQMLFPIAIVPFERLKNWKLFDADRGRDSAREIREYFIPDFSDWKDHDSYQKVFERLVKDLKAQAGKGKASHSLGMKGS